MSDKFSVKVGVHQGTVLSPLLLSIVVIEEASILGVFQGILHAYNLVLMSKSMKNGQRKLKLWKATLESRRMKVYKTK